MLRPPLRATSWFACAALCLLAGCSGGESVATDAGATSATSAPKPFTPTEPQVDALKEPVELWKEGRRAGTIDAREHALDHVFLDLGEGWTPILFTDGTGADAQPEPHKFRGTYLSLARGEFPKDPYGERAQDDKYLELYGIMPTLAVLRSRLKWAHELECAKQLDLTALVNFSGVVTYENPQIAARTIKRFRNGARDAAKAMAAQRVTEPTLITLAKLKPKQQASIKFYLQEQDDVAAVEAAQARLVCEGYFKNKGRWVKGAFDWATHEALAEFERRHRIYSWGAMGSKTVEALRTNTAELEHEAVIRVLAERAMHALGALEDGSAKKGDGAPVTYKGADGREHAVPNLEAELRQAVITGFGLSSPQATLAFLDGLGKLEKDGHRYVAIPGPVRPEYYSNNMDLSVVIDRGDVWYEFPFDENGKPRAQPVSRRPHTNVYVNYLGQRILLARYGTTIGGWKSELIDGSVWWKYKESPPGDVLWQEIVSAPVWLPPNSTPPRELLKRRKKRKANESKWEPNYHETGPSYASAYGLVAAYHRLYKKEADGSIRLGGDEGIRSHGSVDYMSIMRRHSHGCHRLHNHIAVRLFSFVIDHRPHTRSGHAPAAFIMDLEYEEEKHRIEIRRGGYVFRLDQPIFVEVEEGRIKGKVDKPITSAIPKYNAECKAYYLPDGGAVVPRPDGKLIATPPPFPCDTAVPVPPTSEDELPPALGTLSPELRGPALSSAEALSVSARATRAR